MFAQEMDPSFEGKLNRFAPLAAMFAIAVAFVLCLIVIVQAVNTSEALMGRSRIEAAQKAQKHAPPTAVVKCDGANSAACG